MRIASAVLSLTLLIAVAPATAAPPDPQPGSVEWTQRDAENMLYATGRQSDQVMNPAYGQVYWSEAVGEWISSFGDQAQHPDRPVVTLSRVLPGEGADPYRRHWNGARGVQIPIEYINSVGARIQGTIFGPKSTARDRITGERFTGLRPGVVITTGSIQGYEEMYWWAAQGLAENGYIVMTFDVMGQGESENTGHPNAGANTGFTQGTIDALAFFLSDANPLRAYVDEDRIGLAGHSAGAFAVTELGNRPLLNGEPNPVDAVVGWDNIQLPSGVAPRVPTLGEAAEYFFNPTPAFTAPNPAAKSATYQAFRTAGVDAMQVVLRGSTHLEWTSVPYILPASRHGNIVSFYYTLAWFDRWLRGSSEPLVAADASRRLLATHFDDSADVSSIGQGSYDPATQRNVPYTIGGDAVADHLSVYYTSSYAFDGASCLNMRTGC